MKRSWLALVIVAALGLLAGVAIAGRPTHVDDTVINSVATTTAPAAPTTTANTTTENATASTVAGSINPSAVRVLVANGTNRAGIAGRTADVLVAAGFTQALAVDAIESLAITVVFTRPDFEAAAKAVAEELGLAASTVRALPATAVTPVDADADVIVAIGADFPVQG